MDSHGLLLSTVKLNFLQDVPISKYLSSDPELRVNELMFSFLVSRLLVRHLGVNWTEQLMKIHGRHYYIS